jgi:hypothetical protein
MTISPLIEKNIIEALGLEVITKAEQEVVLSNLGSAVVETALLQFLSAQGEWEQQSFEAWVEAHAGEPDMLEQMILLHPTFGKILTEEILQLKENLSGVEQ